MQPENYSYATARHYAAYRPPLHEMILSKAIRESEYFGVGLDIGCGTGYSTHALSKYCEMVTGIDSSLDMLNEAVSSFKSGFKLCSGDDLGEIQTKSVDIATFAGSFFYIKSDRLKRELIRVCHAESALVIYDFEVSLGDLSGIGMTELPPTEEYNHRENVSDWDEFVQEISMEEFVHIKVSSEDYAHIILSDSDRYRIAAQWAVERDPYPKVVGYLQCLRGMHELQVRIFLSRNRLGVLGRDPIRAAPLG